MTTTTATSELTALDRCDRCGAQAYVRVVLIAGGELIFCGHHFDEHGTKLTALSEHVQDERHKLVETNRQQGSAS
jgi:hypothetical protein